MWYIDLKIPNLNIAYFRTNITAKLTVDLIPIRSVKINISQIRQSTRFKIVKIIQVDFSIDCDTNSGYCSPGSLS